MKIVVSFDPEDGTGRLTRSYDIYDPTMSTPDGLWYCLVKVMKELIHDWQWRRAGKPKWEDKEKRLAWKAEAREWTAPIDMMIAAMNERASKKFVLVRADDLRAAMIGCATAYGSSAKVDGKYVLDWFGRLDSALHEDHDVEPE